jgi:hypothetical protein
LAGGGGEADFLPLPKRELTLASDEAVDDRAEEVEEDDDEHPDDFFGAVKALVLNAVNEHPNPEDEEEQGEEEEDDGHKWNSEEGGTRQDGGY